MVEEAHYKIEDTASVEDLESISFPVQLITWSQYDQQSPIILQEENGPCPLIALVNTLLLQSDLNTRKVNFLNSPDSLLVHWIESVGKLKSLLNKHIDKRVPLNEVLTCLGDVLLDLSSAENDVVDRLLKNLPLLHKGLSVNPNLITSGFPPSDLASEMFGAFGLNFVHGWAYDVEKHDQCSDEFAKLQTFDKIQDFLLGSDDKALKEQVQNWLNTNSTQLTAHGLKMLDESLPQDSLAIFFRNNHFSTMYKAHGHEFYLLITDTAFTQTSSNKYVWQSLISVSGKDDLFFSGDFVPILDSSEPHSYPQNEDLELLRQLQEEEDAKMALGLQNRYDGMLKLQKSDKKTSRSSKAKVLAENTKGDVEKSKLVKKSKASCVIV